MNPRDQAWQRLVTAARNAPTEDRDASAPHCFATRVSALAMSADRSAASLFERFSWRALGVAGLLAAVCVIADYSVFNNNPTDEELLPDDGAVAALADFAS